VISSFLTFCCDFLNAFFEELKEESAFVVKNHTVFVDDSAYCPVAGEVLPIVAPRCRSLNNSGA
jgi:hypothetical protein